MKRPSAVWLTATALAALSLAFAAASAAFAVANRGLPVASYVDDPQRWLSAQNAISALVFAAPGWYLATRRPRVPFGWLLLAGALGHGLGGAGWGYLVASEVGGHQWPAAWVALWLQWGLALEVPALVAIYLLYPDARRPRGALAPIAAVLLALSLLGVIAALVDPLTGVAADPNNSIARLHNPIGTNLFASWDAGGVALMAPALIGACLVFLWRWWRAEGDERDVLRWLLIGSLPALAPIDLVLRDSSWSMFAVQAPTIPLLAAVVAGSLRHRVYGIDVVVSRTFIYSALVAVVAGIYALVVGLTSLVAGEANVAAGFVAALVAAFLLAPAHRRIERLINRLLFGQRDEPMALLSRVASRLEASGAPELLLADFATQLVAALRVPYVAIESGGTSIVAPAGRVPDDGHTPFRLAQRGVEHGVMLVGHRAGERGFAPAERELLEHVARQASAAVANLRLTEDLQRSRERIVSAREEERRRLRRDLHDGLGPVLTGIAMMIDAGRHLMTSDGRAADRQLAEARAQVRAAIDDVRRIVYGLRPPALDELGLVGAVREQASRGGLELSIAADGEVDRLPAAVEVAAFRIISEAMTNAVRHAGASVCMVALRVNGALEIEVNDDGSAPAPWRPGVGIFSMRERAAELGGRCEAGPDADGHGRVRAWLPVDGDA